MINKQTLNIVYAVALLTFTGSADACIYGAEKGCKDHLYLADSSELKFKHTAGEQNTLNLSDASVSQGLAIDVKPSISSLVQQDSKYNEIDSDNFNWVPADWYSSD